MKNKLFTRLIEGLILGFGFLSIIGIAFAFSTWSPSQPPQTSPADGNIKLVCPACPTGYHANDAGDACVHDSKANCQTWYDAGYTTDGPYWIDPDGSGPIETRNLYCYMSGGKWALVVGIEDANANHIITTAVAGDLTNYSAPSGKVSDDFINALQNLGRQELVVEGIPYWRMNVGLPTPPEGTFTANAWYFKNMFFRANPENLSVTPPVLGNKMYFWRANVYSASYQPGGAGVGEYDVIPNSVWHHAGRMWAR